MNLLALAGGLFAALAWGSADFLVALVGPRVGVRRTFAATQPLGAVCLLAILALGPWSLSAVLSPGVLGVGLLGAAGYACLYTALARGPAAVASPIGATYGGLAALLAVLAGGETLPALGDVGLALLVAGVVLVALDPSDVRATLRVDTRATLRDRRGITDLARTLFLALGAAVLLGATMFLLDGVVADAGVVPAVTGIRLAGTAVALPLLARDGIPREGWRALVGVAVLDTAAFTAYGVGISAGFVAVVSPVGGLFAVVTVALSVLVLGDRLARLQWFGVLLVLLGTPLLATA